MISDAQQLKMESIFVKQLNMNEWILKATAVALCAMQGQWMIYSEQNIPQDSLCLPVFILLSDVFSVDSVSLV